MSMSSVQSVAACERHLREAIEALHDATTDTFASADARAQARQLWNEIHDLSERCWPLIQLVAQSDDT